MSKNKEDIINSAIAGGIIGASLGALITGKSKGSLLASIVGAALGASFEALKEAKDKKLSVMVEDEGSLYWLHPDGKKEFIKKIPKSDIAVPKAFVIE